MSHFKTSMCVSLCACLLLAVACKGDKSSSAKDVVGKDIAVPDATQSATIGPNGGTVALEGGAVLEVPAGALAEKVTFELSWTPSPDELVPGITSVTDVLRIMPSGTVFDPPATLTLPYDMARVPADDAPGSVAVYVSSSENADWQLLETTVGDGVLTASVSHLSQFAGGSGCRANGNGCFSSADCCSDACWESHCAPCRSSGQTCNSGFDCCDGLICNAGACEACRPQGGACGHTADCCSIHASACVDGTCQACLQAGTACTTGSNCCGSLACLDGVCTDGCAQTGENCTNDEECCSHKSDGVVCKGGTCVPCDQPGQACNLFTCCGQSICLSSVCEACQQEGTSCGGDISCCSRKCTHGQCRTCRTDGQECDGPADCCSGTCTNNDCVACPGKGAACGADADCCPGSCCEQLSTLVCEEGQCSDCVRPGQSCAGPGAECCGENVCVQGACVACVPLGTECASDLHCCGYTLASGIRCLSGICRQCGFTNDDCDADTPCCVEQCMQGKCRSCLPGGEPCENNGECCQEKCVNNLCEACAGYGESCETMACCGDGALACVGGTCTCALPGEDCSTVPCCPGETCSANKTCESCASKGESCEDDQCCPGLECGGNEECYDPDEPPPGGCSCNTPGVTLTKMSGCDGWPDARSRSGPEGLLPAAGSGKLGHGHEPIHFVHRCHSRVCQAGCQRGQARNPLVVDTGVCRPHRSHGTRDSGVCRSRRRCQEAPSGRCRGIARCFRRVRPSNSTA